MGPRGQRQGDGATRQGTRDAKDGQQHEKLEDAGKETPPPGPSEGALPRQQLDVRLPAFTTVRKKYSVVFSPQVMVLGYGGLETRDRGDRAPDLDKLSVLRGISCRRQAGCSFGHSSCSTYSGLP